MGVPRRSENKPPVGVANVCKEGGFFGKKLQVGNLQNDNVIEVVATGFYICTDFGFPDIQLSPDDALTLFPITKLSQKENVFIVPLD